MYFDVSVSKKAGWQQIPCHIVGISIVITEEGAYDRKDRIPCKPVAGIHMILVQRPHMMNTDTDTDVYSSCLSHGKDISKTINGPSTNTALPVLCSRTKNFM